GRSLPSSEDLPLEVRYVRYGLKPMALAHGSASQVSNLAASARGLGLKALISPYEFQPAPDATASGYVNLARGWRPATPDSNGWRGLLVGKDYRQLQLRWLSLLFGWD